MITHRSLAILLVTGALVMGDAGAASTILFDGRWREGGWLGEGPWRRAGTRLQVGTDRAEGPIWRALPQTLWDTRRAHWRWGVALVGPAERERPAATLAIRFVFTPTEAARRLARVPARRTARDDRARSLIYVWGGAGPPGTIALSADGRTARITRRQGGTGSASETVDLAVDYQRAFDHEPEALVALAISADAAGAGGPIEAAVADLQLD